MSSILSGLVRRQRERESGRKGEGNEGEGRVGYLSLLTATVSQLGDISAGQIQSGFTGQHASRHPHRLSLLKTRSLLHFTFTL